MNEPTDNLQDPIISVVIPVYRDAERAIALLNSLGRQVLPTSTSIQIIVIDDGSGDDTADRIEALAARDVHLIRMEKNGGRSVARNHAAKKSTGDFILFMDCDCLPAREDFVSQHLSTCTDGCVASIGPLVGDGVGFWHRYQSDSSERRTRQHAAGITYSGTSSNLMVARWAFVRCSGFDEDYCGYGFEDRDLQIRLSTLGPIALASNAVVQHMDSLSLRIVSRKMQQAGEFTSTRFSNHHPDAYRMLGFASFDVRQQRWLGVAAALADNLCEPLARLGDSFLECGWLPYPFKRAYVLAVTALSFLAGTARAKRSATYKKI